MIKYYGKNIMYGLKIETLKSYKIFKRGCTLGGNK